jgi:16S rRNA (cytosine967-C5)-methyltransferase
MSVSVKRKARSTTGQRSTPVVSVARRAAFEILRRVEEEGAFASVLLAATDEEMRTDDRALCYELVLGVLRWQLWLDRLIVHYSKRKAEGMDVPVRVALRLGLYQLRLLTRIPASAVVNESVNLAHVARVRSAAGLINAVLRRATRETDYDPLTTIDDPIERLSVAASHPQWLIARWVEAFGMEWVEAFALANNVAPPVAFRLTGGQEEDARLTLDELQAVNARVVPSNIAPEAWRVEGGGAVLRRLAVEGRVYLQDEASQLVSHVLDAQPDERVLDMCAAPGSKTTHIAARTGDRALVVACDIHEHRLRTVIEAGTRARLKSIRAVTLDATSALPFAEESFDRVLVDAPCSGTGTLKRNPEIRWRLRASDIFELAAQQQRLLTQAAAMVRRGGRLVYSTCSVEPEENEAIVAKFLREQTSFVQIVATAPASLLAASGAARTWPHRDGADGFFVAAFERRQ